MRSIENDTGDYCVDIFVREDESFGFEEFRRDTEDMGKWTAINYFSALSFENQDEALGEARKQIRWLSD